MMDIEKAYNEEIKRMMKDYEIMEQVEKLTDKLCDASFMAMFCTMFDTRFGEKSVQKAEACVEQMRLLNRALGTFLS